MINFSSRIWIVIHVALLVIWSSWARGGSAPAYFWALPWLSLFVIEIIFAMPPRTRGDSLGEAIGSLLKKILKDPVFYLGTALSVYMLIQWLNGPMELVYNEMDSRWEYTDPPVKGLPFCVNREEASHTLIWFSTLLPALLAIRHCIGPKLKYLLLKILVINSALLSILGLLHIMSASDKLFWYRDMPVYFFSTFGYPNHAGSFFVLMTAVNMGLLFRNCMNRDTSNHPIFWAIMLIINIAGVLGSLSRAAIVLLAILLVFSLIYGVYILRDCVNKKVMTIVAMLTILASGFAFVKISSKGDLLKEIQSLDVDAFKTVYVTDRAFLKDAAIDIWKDYPWTGVGSWGFRRYVGLYADKSEWKLLESKGKANVHNDPVQFLCEHGMIGAGIMLALTVSLFVSLIIRLTQMTREVEPVAGIRLSWMKSLSPVVVLSLAGLIAVLVHSTIDLPFRSAAIIYTWFFVLACLPGFVHKS